LIFIGNNDPVTWSAAIRRSDVDRNLERCILTIIEKYNGDLVVMRFEIHIARRLYTPLHPHLTS
jgi:hypothetical protein